MSAQPLVAFFNQIDKHDLPSVGGKGANLGEMTQAGFPVPNGFAVTVAAYDLFLERSEISKKIQEILKVTDVNKSDELQKASIEIGKIVTGSEIPEEITKDVRTSYRKLSGTFRKALVAV